MTPRLNPYMAAPEQVKPFIDFALGLNDAGLEHSLMELVKIRASQINRCGFCLHMHTRDAREQGETEERIYMLDAWRESPLYSDRERAALAWTESLTRIAETGAPDDVYEQVRAEFGDKELVTVTLLIVAINGFNRLGAGFHIRHPVGAARKAA